MFQNGTCALFAQLAAFVDVAQVLSDSRALGAQKLRQLGLVEPDCYPGPAPLQAGPGHLRI